MEQDTELLNSFVEEVTDVSEIPCRLIDDAHERRNEIPTVPS